jgi:hypothetical protein
MSEIPSWMTAPQYAEYHDVLTPKIITRITTIERRKVLIRRLDVGYRKRRLSIASLSEENNFSFETAHPGQQVATGTPRKKFSCVEA